MEQTSEGAQERASASFSRRKFVTVAAAGVAVAPILGAGPANAAAGSSAPAGSEATFSSTAASPAVDAAHARAVDLVGQMSLDDKIALVHGIGFGGGGDYAGATVANTALGIPALILGDGADGVGNGATGVTQWPVDANQASTWDPELVQTYARAMGAEHRAKGRSVALGPTVNILRRPTWGRAFETFTEDPYLNGQLAVAAIRGIQQEKVIATVKHFACNNQEVLRNSINVVVSRRALEEIYYPAFKAAVQQGGVGAVMAAYNQVNGYYNCENEAGLTGALRDEWGYAGFVMSDWFAQHSTVASAQAGLDMEQPDDSYYGAALKSAVQVGTVSTATLDAMVTRILTSMIQVGVFDDPPVDPSTVDSLDVASAEHLALATKLSEQGTVLLKNDGVLPLDARRLRSIAVIGDAASTNPKTGGLGSPAVNPSTAVVTPLQGITARAGAQVDVTFTQGTLGLAALTTVPGSALTPASGSGNGLTGTYYATDDFSGTPLGTEVDPGLDFTATPALVGSATTWSAQWTGTLAAPAAGDYRFSVTSSGNVVLKIDGHTVVTYTSGYESVFNGLIHLAKGPHAIEVSYVNTGTSFFGFVPPMSLQVGWQPQEDLLIAAAAAAARAADVAVVYAYDYASEGMDRSTLALPADQDRLIEAVAAANPRTIVVLNTSGAVLMPWLDRVAAVFEAWYGGQTAGTAIASLLFGDANPSAKIAHTFPASDAQGPARTTDEYPGNGTDVYYNEGILVGYRWYDANNLTPLFPFGHGLSYTQFRYGDLRVDDSRARGKGPVSVSVSVTNTGRVAGAEVAQVYLGNPRAAGEPPKQLKAFQKAYLQPGERRTLSFQLDQDDLSVFNEASSSWTVVPGTYTVAVGGSSADLPVRASFRI
ncbi:glycoside hydrolase family 3 C-terminal domain-containing protein [Actinospica durhamensis]|uniref:Exo-alpha-(1->6)-L-arabinopyranosidase n=1 Tax=Actinospica durhamensis TaxID=1508375 RepID=A0A941EKV0_9ACTN|nr:glycoside hydrolase family 3 C-terminal domain-containing protein [Actinospica durhamensis]MBR7833462.1 glycoside hydrolase family 3 C-terminal domain-containing protein [Actinospica durhamensis]